MGTTQASMYYSKVCGTSAAWFVLFVNRGEFNQSHGSFFSQPHKVDKMRFEGQAQTYVASQQSSSPCEPCQRFKPVEA